MIARRDPEPAVSVLLIETGPPDLELLLEGSLSPRFSVQRVDSAREAMRELDRRRYDVLLADLGSVELRRLATLRYRLDHPPIVAVVDSPEPGQALAAVQAGAHDVLVRGEIGAVSLSRTLWETVKRGRLSIGLGKEVDGLRITGLRDPVSFVAALEAAMAQVGLRSGVTLLLLRPRCCERGVDREMRRLARCLRQGLGPDHDLSCLGGDRLAVLFCGIEGMDTAAGFLRRVREALAEPFDPQGKIRVSFGVAMFPRDGRTGAELIDAADRALWLFEKLTGARSSPLADPVLAAAVAEPVAAA